MIALAIETSCDETGVSIAEGEKIPGGFECRVLGNALLSQAPLHAEYGGVYPTLAKREHQKNLPVLLERLLHESDIQAGKIDAIAVTEGPGLEPALWTGITFAKKLAAQWDKPLFGVNHMEGHLISSLAKKSENPNFQFPIFKLEDIAFPVLGLLVSGGHTMFVRSDDWFRYAVLGETLDDAVGECFDKVARMLGLPYPGGPHISRLADQAREAGRKSPIGLPRPMIASGTCDTSFSGLKTAALYALRDIGGAETLSEKEKAAFAREFEDAVADVFIAKTRKALSGSAAGTFVIGGGVAANKHLRESLVGMIGREFPEVEIRLPELSITGDNAIMIAEAALLRFLAGNWRLSAPPSEIRASGTLALA